VSAVPEPSADESLTGPPGADGSADTDGQAAAEKSAEPASAGGTASVPERDGAMTPGGAPEA